jgi:hypothetical protein
MKKYQTIADVLCLLFYSRIISMSELDMEKSKKN